MPPASTSAGTVPLAAISSRESNRSPMAAAHATSSRSAGSSHPARARIDSARVQGTSTERVPRRRPLDVEPPGLDDGPRQLLQRENGLPPARRRSSAFAASEAGGRPRISSSIAAAAASSASGPRVSSSPRRERRISALSPSRAGAGRSRRPPRGRWRRRRTGAPRSARARNGISETLVASAQCRSSRTTRAPRDPARAPR